MVKMTNIRELNKIKEEFKQTLENQENLKLNSSLELEKKENTKQDLTKLIDCSKDYFEDLIKVYSEEEYVISLKEDSTLNLSGTGLIYIIVENSVKLELNFEENLNSQIFIKILVKENQTLNLVENLNSQNLSKFISTTLEKNSKLISAQTIKNTKISQNTTILEKNSNYDLKSAFLIEDNKTYIQNKSIHLESNSQSNMSVNGAVLGKSHVYNDGLVRIENSAPNSIGHQNMQNLILEQGASINSEPILEIENNNVECSHGSSVSDVSEDVLFYMNSKGISKEIAINLIVEGFFEKVKENILEN